MTTQGFWEQFTRGIQRGLNQFSQNLSQISTPRTTPAQMGKVPGLLAQLCQAVQENPIPKPGTQYGERTKLIRLIQTSLQSLGYYQTGAIDGKYGSKTKQAVKNFQKNNNLIVTGTVNSATAAKLYKKIETQKRQGQLIPSLMNLATQWGLSELIDEYPQVTKQPPRPGPKIEPIHPPETQGINWTPILIGGGALIGIILLVEFMD